MTLKQKIQTNYLFRFSASLLVLFTFLNSYSQTNGVAINTTGTAAHTSAILDLRNSVGKGLLLPQVNNVVTDVSSPYQGLVVYQTGSTPGVYYYTGSAWILLGGASGNGNYILNQTSIQSGASFNIGNAGVIGTTLSVGGLSTLTGVTNTGTLTSSGGAINLNTSSAGNVNIGGNGGSTAQTVNIGAASSSDGLTTNIYSGGGGVNINVTTSNRTTTIGGASGIQPINIGSSGATGTIAIGSVNNTTNILSNSSGVNINKANSQPTTINAGSNNGSVTIGGINPSATTAQTITVGGNGYQTINVGTAVGNSSVVTIGTNSADAVTTNILSGTGGVNINAAGTNNVTIGNATGNFILPKFSTLGTVLYSSATTGQISATAQGATGQVLTSNGAGAPTWSSASSLTLGQSATTVFGSGSLNNFSSSSFTVVPNLITSVTVPTTGTYSVYISTDGGIRTLSGSNNGYSSVDIAIAIDGTIVTNGLYQRVTALNNSNLGNNYNYWSMSSVQSISSGTTHIITVYAADTGNSGNGEVISGDANSVLQGQLTVILIKQ